MTQRLARWREYTDVPLVVVAVGSLPLLILETVRSDLVVGDRIFLDIVNAVVCVLFLVDYCVELVLASPRRAYVKREWTSAAVVVAQVVALLPGAAGLGVFRATRFARAARPLVGVARALAIGGAAATEGRSIVRRHAGGLAVGVAGFTWITSAVAFTLVEDVGTGARIHSFFDALWWSSATITTVGYGDIYPITFAGRLVGIFTMFVGISTFAVVTAKVAEFLVRPEAEAGAVRDLIGKP